SYGPAIPVSPQECFSDCIPATTRQCPMGGPNLQTSAGSEQLLGQRWPRPASGSLLRQASALASQSTELVPGGDEHRFCHQHPVDLPGEQPFSLTSALLFFIVLVVISIFEERRAIAVVFKARFQLLDMQLQFLVGFLDVGHRFFCIGAAA